MKSKLIRTSNVIRSFSVSVFLIVGGTSLTAQSAATSKNERLKSSKSHVLSSANLRREIASELKQLIRESASTTASTTASAATSAATSAPAATAVPAVASSLQPGSTPTVVPIMVSEPPSAVVNPAKEVGAVESRKNETKPEPKSKRLRNEKHRSSETERAEKVQLVSPQANPDTPKLTTLRPFQNSQMQLSNASETPLIFDIPVTYNERVRSWIRYFQTTGHSSFRRWLERSSRYMPLLQYELNQAGLPQDLVYVAMIESGFNSHAESHAAAMGMWQFIAPTGKRYGLKIDWWIDERRDFHKATGAAIRYMTDLHRQFGSWYLVAASYNMGENGVRRLIARHKTNNFWELAEKEALPKETRDYVPKIIAAVLISKAPALYGFRNLEYQMPLSYEYSNVPGGTELARLADHLGVSEKYLKDLNPELLKGYVPKGVRTHKIRVPKGSVMTVSRFVGTIDPTLN